MWSFFVEFLDDDGKVIRGVVVSASNSRHAEIIACRKAPDVYSGVSIVRL